MLIAAPAKEFDAVSAVCGALAGNGSLAITMFQETAKTSSHDTNLLRLEYRHESRAECQQLVDRLQLALRERPEMGRIAAPYPSVEREIQTISLSVPAERITVSVDTRPAREWL
jgi:hypothetical protein